MSCVVLCYRATSIHAANNTALNHRHATPKASTTLFFAAYNNKQLVLSIYNTCLVPHTTIVLSFPTYTTTMFFAARPTTEHTPRTFRHAQLKLHHHSHDGRLLRGRSPADYNRPTGSSDFSKPLLQVGAQHVAERLAVDDQLPHLDLTPVVDHCLLLLLSAHTLNQCLQAALGICTGRLIAQRHMVVVQGRVIAHRHMVVLQPIAIHPMCTVAYDGKQVLTCCWWCCGCCCVCSIQEIQQSKNQKGIIKPRKCWHADLHRMCCCRP